MRVAGAEHGAAAPPPAPDARPPLLAVSGLGVSARLDGGETTLLSGVELTVRPGEAVAVVGESGSGKSLTARAIAGLLPRGMTATGSVRLHGRELLTMDERERARTRGREVVLLPQDPFTQLSPVRRCGAQIMDGLRVAEPELPRAQARRRVLEVLEEVGLPAERVVDAYPFELSGGMRQRVGIAAALVCGPSLMLADEPSTALDVTTQAKVLRLLRTLHADREMGLVLITHDLRVAFSVCDRVHVLYAGQLLEVGGAAQLEREPRHPYSAALLQAEPNVERRVAGLGGIPGQVPAAAAVVDRCAFADRCRWCDEACSAARPPLADLGAGRESACVRLPEIGDELARWVRERRGRDDEGAAAPLAGDGLIALEGVTKSYRGNGEVVRALDDVSVALAAGECVGIIGESGSGKSTLAKVVSGLERADAGRVRVGAVDLSNGLAKERRRELAGTAQMVFQDPYTSLNPSRTVRATLRQALQMCPGAAATDAEVAALLEQVQLPQSYAARKPVALSGGERQRVAIARAIAMRPQVLVCDEAVSALDVSVQAEILKLLLRIKREQGVSLLFITHDFGVLRQVADRTYVMRQGRVVESGPTEAVLTAPRHPYTRELLAAVPGRDGHAGAPAARSEPA